MKISFVIPTINSSKTIEKNMKILDGLISKIKEIEDYEIIVAAQTSEDNTFRILDRIRSKRIIPIFIREKGKGAGLTAGIKKAKFEWILMTDDDLPYSLEFVRDSIQDTNSYDLIIGSRYLRKNANHMRFLRGVLSFFYRKLVNIFFKISQSDVQAGMKLIKKNIFQKIPYPREVGWVWDTELLYFANKKRLKIIEKPVSLSQASNQLKIIKDVPKMLLGLLLLKIRILQR